MVDLFLSRPFYSGRSLICNYAIGLNAGKIDQNINVDYVRVSNDNPLFFESSLNSWFLGPVAKIESKFIFGYNFSYYLDASASIFYQDSKVKILLNNPSNYLTILDNAKNKLNLVNSNLTISTGLNWGSYFSNERYHFFISAGYEMRNYFNQNLIVELNGLRRNGYMQEAGSLYMHGLIAKMGFDF